VHLQRRELRTGGQRASLPLDGASTPAERGRIVARALRGAWRADPPAPEISADELRAVAPALLRTGSAPLAFWRNRAIAEGAPGLEPLQDTWRMQALHGALLEERLAVAAARLHAASLSPLLAKGWAIARRYPRPGLRPYGDIDVYVRPSDYAAARAVVDTLPGIAVDLHRGLPDLDERVHDTVLARARWETTGGVAVRVLSLEDHLRLLCRHFLRHGAARPVWLCDVALLVETCGRDLDWNLVLDGAARRRDAILAALAMARVLLGADLGDTPAARVDDLPAWIVPTVLKQWGDAVGHREPLAIFLSRPRGFGAELRRHWPNGLEASAALDAPFDGRARFPFQLAHVIVRGAHFVLSLARRVARGLIAAPARDRPAGGRC
jgi:Uncharacterised nucleotidyltransferase